MASERIRCYWCNKFISHKEMLEGAWTLIQAPGVSDPEPYEIHECHRCRERARGRDGDTPTPAALQGAM